MVDPFKIKKLGKRETTGFVNKSERRVSGGGDSSSPYGIDTRNMLQRLKKDIVLNGRNLNGGGERRTW